MQKYVVEKATLDAMLAGKSHDFAIKKDKSFFLYIPDETGTEKVFLSKEMGKVADEILEKFLKKLDIISNSNVCEWQLYNIVDANSILIIFGSNEITHSIGNFLYRLYLVADR